MMKNGRGARVVGGLLLSGMLASMGGCGYKTNPLPPEAIVPKAIEDLRYAVKEDGATLSWSYPIETIKGTDLTEVSSFDLYRAEVPLKDYCATCPIPFAAPIQVSGGTVEAEGRRQANYQASLLRNGHKYFFKVNARTSWWAASPDSNIISFVWHVPAAAPAGVAVRPGDREITLAWQPVTMLSDGQRAALPIRYRIARSQNKKDFQMIAEGLQETRYVDRTVSNGENYQYTVQSQLLLEQNSVNGGTSAPVAVSPVDLTPPAAPTGVTAVITGKGVKIFWDKSKDKDLHGYRIYRRLVDQGKTEQIGDIRASVTVFEDLEAPAGGRIAYSVTAYDAAKPANESKPSKEALIRE